MNPERVSPARRRMALARRVAHELGLIQGAQLLGPDPDVTEQSLALPHADFLMVVLDLRVRVFLDLEELDEDGRVSVARDLLSQWPDTGAVAIVTDDGSLETVLYEPYDVMSQMGGAGPTVTEGPGPLRDVLREYLHVLSLGWQPPTSLVAMEPLNMGGVARFAAANALHSLADVAARVSEKKAALELVAGVDDSILATLVEEIIGSPQPSLSIEALIARLKADQ